MWAKTSEPITAAEYPKMSHFYESSGQGHGVLAQRLTHLRRTFRMHSAERVM
jgi:hypothetical protein